MVSRPRIWQIWENAQNYPCLEDQENQLYNYLVKHANGIVPPSVSATSLLMSILRSGVTMEQAIAQAPGIPIEKLLSSYNSLHHQINSSLNAWSAIISEPSRESLLEHGPQLSTMLPSLVYRSTLIAHQFGQSELENFIQQVREIVDDATRISKSLEEDIHKELSLEKKREFGLFLYHLQKPSIWFSPYFLPTRVTQLEPRRVKVLLSQARSTHYQTR